MNTGRDSQLVVTRDGVQGIIAPNQSRSDDQHVVIAFADGESVVVPAQLLIQQHDGSYVLDAAYRDLQRPMDNEQLIIPVLREDLVIDRARVETGRVQVHKIVEERQEVIEEPIVREDVVIERVAINRLLTEPAVVRVDGDVTIVPLMEEVLVVEKRLLLREEVHIHRRTTRTVHQETVTLRTEDVRIGRISPDKTSESS